MKRYTVKDFDKQFPTEDSCLEFLKNARWPQGLHCEKCGKTTKHHRITTRKVYSCDFCGTQVSPMAGTIFHKSETPLRSWFYAIFLMASTRCGISAKQLERELGVTYKTAWRMFHQIRKLMAEDSGFLSGHVEADDTYIGGERHGKHGRGAQGKTPVVGMVERGGRALAQSVPNLRKSTIAPIVRRHLLDTRETAFYTDEFSSYSHVRKLGYTHERVQHSAKVYVRGSVHTNTIEGFWSLVKRGINGVYHAVSVKHLQSYLDEYVYRYNHRKDEVPMFHLLLDRVAVCATRRQAELPS